jgi:hypothetical protein
MKVDDVIQLPPPVPVRRESAPAAVVSAPATPPAYASTNLSQQAAGTYHVLSGGAAFPASNTPTFVLPANARGLIQLYNAIQAIAVERVYPAPIFSFSA